MDFVLPPHWGCGRQVPLYAIRCGFNYLAAIDGENISPSKLIFVGPNAKSRDKNYSRKIWLSYSEFLTKVSQPKGTAVRDGFFAHSIMSSKMMQDQNFSGV
jgi:hypothetical protein